MNDTLASFWEPDRSEELHETKILRKLVIPRAKVSRLRKVARIVRRLQRARPQLSHPQQIIIVVLSIICLLSVTGASYFFARYRQVKMANGPAPSAELQQEKIIAAVSKSIDLPPGETPTIATVANVDKLKGQPFFAKAKNGDKIIIFPTAKRAILYDPVANKILAVEPFVLAPTKMPEVAGFQTTTESTDAATISIIRTPKSAIATSSSSAH